MLTFGNQVNYPKDLWSLRAITVQVEGSRMAQQGFQSTSPCSCTHLLPKKSKRGSGPSKLLLPRLLVFISQSVPSNLGGLPGLVFATGPQ